MASIPVGVLQGDGQAPGEMLGPAPLPDERANALLRSIGAGGHDRYPRTRGPLRRMAPAPIKAHPGQDTQRKAHQVQHGKRVGALAGNGQQ
jgi:hypothetical protein